jgi:hypothetical protein
MGRDHSEDLDVDGRMMSSDFRQIGWEGVDWIHLAQDRDQWRTVVNTVMNLWVAKRRGIKNNVNIV